MSASVGYLDPAVREWLEAFSAPETLKLGRRDSLSATGQAPRLLGKAYRGSLAVLNLELVGLLRMGLHADAKALLVVLKEHGKLEGSCGGRGVIDKTYGLLGTLFPGEQLDLSCATPTASLFFLCLPYQLMALVSEIYDKQPLTPRLVVQALHGFELVLVPILEAFVKTPAGVTQADYLQGLRQLEVALLSTLVRLMPDGDSPSPPAPAPPPRSASPGDLRAPHDLCDRAIQFMLHNLAHPIRIESLAEACGVSKRSLQLAFQTKLGTSPMLHLRQLRLSTMHDQLNLGASVKSACVAAGLPATGRTSLQYFEFFGETPSATRLKSSSAQSAPI